MNHSAELTIRRSPVTLAIRLVVAEIMLEILYIGSKLILHFLEQEELIVNALGLSLALNILFLPLAVSVIALLFAIWVSEEYIIKAEELVAKHGVLTTRHTAYPYIGMQRIHVKQGILGKTFNYGTVLVYMPVLGQEISFNELSNPHGFASMLKKYIPDTGQTQFLLKRS